MSRRPATPPRTTLIRLLRDLYAATPLAIFVGALHEIAQSHKPAAPKRGPAVAQ